MDAQTLAAWLTVWKGYNPKHGRIVVEADRVTAINDEAAHHFYFDTLDEVLLINLILPLL